MAEVPGRARSPLRRRNLPHASTRLRGRRIIRKGPERNSAADKIDKARTWLPTTPSEHASRSAGSVRVAARGRAGRRLGEDIGRAERHGTHLSCLLIVVENLEELAGEHGGELREQTMAYMAGALRSDLRRFDRVGMPSDRELLIVLPGADGPRGEIVARRVLDRLRAIKVEATANGRPCASRSGSRHGARKRRRRRCWTVRARRRGAGRQRHTPRHGGNRGRSGESSAQEPTAPPS